jgi:transposase-like protein
LPLGSGREVNRRHSAAERERLLAEYQTGTLTAHDFALEHDIRPSTLATWLRNAKREARREANTPRRFTPEERRAAVEAFLKSGRKREDFARLWGCSPSSIDKWVRRYQTVSVRSRSPGLGCAV